MKASLIEHHLPFFCCCNHNLKIKTSPIFHFISHSVMVFSTIKFYGVPAGHHVRRDSPDKEVSTRCCEPSHAITTTVSWLSVLFYFACILPQHTKQQDGTTRAASSAALSTSGLFHILHVWFPPLVWWKGDCAAARRTHFVYSVDNIELKWWIHCFRLGREGSTVG